MKKQAQDIETITNLMKKIERNLMTCSKTSYLGALESPMGVNVNSRENVLELIQDSFQDLLPILYAYKDANPNLDIEEVLIRVWYLK